MATANLSREEQEVNGKTEPDEYFWSCNNQDYYYHVTVTIHLVEWNHYKKLMHSLWHGSIYLFRIVWYPVGCGYIGMVEWYYRASGMSSRNTMHFICVRSWRSSLLFVQYICMSLAFRQLLNYQARKRLMFSRALQQMPHLTGCLCFGRIEAPIFLFICSCLFLKGTMARPILNVWT